MLSNNQIEIIVDKIVNNVFIKRFNELEMNATGEWLDSVKAKDNTIVGQSYTEFLAKGREPGKPPLIAPLEKWVKAKLGLQGKIALSVAFAISKKIAKEGTSWHQQGGTDLLKILESKEVYEMFVKEYATEIKKTTITEFQRNLKLS